MDDPEVKRDQKHWCISCSRSHRLESDLRHTGRSRSLRRMESPLSRRSGTARRTIKGKKRGPDSTRFPHRAAGEEPGTYPHIYLFHPCRGSTFNVHRRRSQLRFQLPLSRRKPRDTPELQRRIQPIRSRRIPRILLRASTLSTRPRSSNVVTVTTGSAPDSSVSEVGKKQKHKERLKLVGLDDNDSCALTQSGDEAGEFTSIPGSIGTRNRGRN